MKILLLEDDYLYRISIKEFLESLHYEVIDFEDGKEAYHALFEQHFDLLIFDIRVPGMDGFTILEELQKQNIHKPTLILTSLTDIDSLSTGYKLGCNDYLRKPFDMLEFKYRIEQLIKTSCFSTDKQLLKLYSDYEYDTLEGLLFKTKQPIELTQKEQQLVSLLIQNRGFFLSIEKLHELIWENKEISYADIRMCIKRIREKTDSEFIKNKRFVGYKIDK